MNIFSKMNASMPIDEFSQKGFGISSLKESQGTDFKTVLSGLVSNLNHEVEKPDQLLTQQMMGNQDVDIHDVTTAIAKAELVAIEKIIDTTNILLNKFFKLPSKFILHNL